MVRIGYLVPKNLGSGIFTSSTQDLTPQAFNEKVLQEKKLLDIDFYASWCDPGQNFTPESELLDRMIKGKQRLEK